MDWVLIHAPGSHQKDFNQTHSFREGPLSRDLTQYAARSRSKEPKPMTNRHSTFNTLVAEALAQDFSGWDFSWADGRWQEEDPPWDYTAIVRQALPAAGTLLDLDTGGGEILASLVPLPDETIAIESYTPNIAVAKARLEPLGVQVVTPDDRADASLRRRQLRSDHQSPWRFPCTRALAHPAARRALHHPAGG